MSYSQTPIAGAGWLLSSVHTVIFIGARSRVVGGLKLSRRGINEETCLRTNHNCPAVEPAVALPVDSAPIAPVVSDGQIVSAAYGHYRRVYRRARDGISSSPLLLIE